jgi:hypothetical protein
VSHSDLGAGRGKAGEREIGIIVSASATQRVSEETASKDETSTGVSSEMTKRVTGDFGDEIDLQVETALAPAGHRHF